MPQSLSQIIVHTVFSTKNRTPWLNEQLQPEVFSLLSSLLKGRGHTPILVGGRIDHVHLLYGLSRTQTVARTIEDVKVPSTKWLKDSIPDFSWQNGYGAFSLGYTSIDSALAYIKNQNEHHKVVSFKDEFRRLCEEHGVSLDERYAWD